MLQIIDYPDNLNSANTIISQKYSLKNIAL